MSGFVDGLSHTFVCVETIDTTASRWCVGDEATLVGIPNAIVTTCKQSAMGNFYCPDGTDFDGTYDASSNVMLKNPTWRCWIAYDFSTNSPDHQAYYTEDNTGLQTAFGSSHKSPYYGPSSGHPAVVNHLMGDQSVQAISKQVDIPAYFFMITRYGSDPFHLP
jgi:hypothetical protein